MPVTEVRESQMSIMTIDNNKKSLPFLRSEKLFRAESHFATVKEKMKYYKESGNSSEKHIRHCQGYNQVHGTSAKITVLYKKNN